MMKIFLKSFQKGVVTRKLPPFKVSAEYEALGGELKKLIKERFGRSFHIREVDTGSCGACESEIIAMSNPIYDMQRFGVDVAASPRHADALLVTGTVSKNMELALKRTYDAMPAPKLVITCGDCALDGGPFKGAHYICGGVSKVIPVNAHIEGCPPKPEAVINAVLSLLRDIK